MYAMKINKKLLPIKLHYFFFMGALGPILPQLPLFGKDLGISPVVMGTVTGILPFTFLLTKPIFGLLIDVYRQWRKLIFVCLIILMTICFVGIYFVPKFELLRTNYTLLAKCEEETFVVVCNSSCLAESPDRNLCLRPSTGLVRARNCTFVCIEDTSGLYRSFTFWSFIIFMSLGTIGFNVINSISDAICFDIVDDQSRYGEQRLWGSVGFGLAGLISGYAVDVFSSYLPAFLTMATLSFIDLMVCVKLELPVIEAPKNIVTDLRLLLTNQRVVIFMTFTILAGMLDGLVIYFLFWYLEDLALETSTTQVKLIEGLTLAAETLGAEALFFSISGRILQKLGHVHTFTVCFFNYAIRLGLISLASSPWWILPIELFSQGPTFALTYTAIVAYANDLAPPGMSATMQGIAAGMGDGTGYAIGSVLGGWFYRSFGGRITFQIFTVLALVCGVLHFTLHRSVSKEITNHRRRDYDIID